MDELLAGMKGHKRKGTNFFKKDRKGEINRSEGTMIDAVNDVQRQGLQIEAL